MAPVYLEISASLLLQEITSVVIFLFIQNSLSSSYLWGIRITIFFFFFTCLRILMQCLIVTEQCHLQRRMPPIIKETPKWTILGNCLFKKNKSEIRESVILSGTSHWTPLFTFLMFSYFIASGYQSIYCQQLGTVGVAVFVILMIFYRKMQ